MKAVVISGSSKLRESIAYWRGYFEGSGHRILDYPTPEDTPDALATAYQRFYGHLDQADLHFIMNVDKNGIEGYLGPSTFAELAYSVVRNLNHDHTVEIRLLKLPSPDQNCYEEVKFWLDRGWIKLFGSPAPAASAQTSMAPLQLPQPLRLSSRRHKLLDVKTCHHRSLKFLNPKWREYLSILSPTFPAWLLRYLAAPEMQRLHGVSQICVDHGGAYDFPGYNSVLTHSLGVALIVWHFTHDQKQTLAALFHDIASPSFKHCIDFMNGDATTQESTEDRTDEIIRGSKVIRRELRRDHILPSEVSDYHLFPIADNDLPGLAADRLEYNFSNGLFLYGTFTLDQIRHFYKHLQIFKNERGEDEIGFNDPTVCAEYVEAALPLFAEYQADRARATMQFTADIIRSMFIAGLLNQDDLYQMSEREIADWILSCGESYLMNAYREFQRCDVAFTSSTAKKDCYCTDVKGKLRYINPLATYDKTCDISHPHPSSSLPTCDISCVARITSLDPKIATALEDFANRKLPKYVGFDFEFTPYTE